MKLKKLLACAITCCAAFNAAAKDADTATPLSFHNTHTNESIVIHHTRGQSVSAEANRFMRDWRRNQPADMDPRLLDLLVELKTAINRRHPDLKVVFDIICAFRNLQTNEMLRQKIGPEGKPSQAKDSEHLHGKAMDFRVPGLKLEELRDIATCLYAGGVGYYPSADNRFIHADVGRVRYWPSRAYLQTLKCD